MVRLPNIHLNLSNKAENILLVREMLTGVAQAIGLESADLNDLRTAVTEACNNVVLHAYEGEERGPLESEVHIAAGSIEVMVRDRGVGIWPCMPRVHDDASGIGMSVIKALTQSVEFSSSQGKGTEVRMRFATPGSPALKSLPGEEALELPAFAPNGHAGTIRIAIAPIRLASAVLPRLLCVLAARAHFSTDRISDAQLVADALLAQTPESIGAGYLGFGIGLQPRALELRLWPLRRDRASWRSLDSGVAGLSPVLAKLTNQHGVVAVGSSEALSLRLSD